MDLNINAEQIKSVLSGLTPALKNKILKSALQLISKPILLSAENKVWLHQRTGRLYRSLGQRATIINDEVAILLGANKSGRFKGSHAHFLENGTKERSYITKTGKLHKTGKTKGINYWSSSIEDTSKQSGSDFSSYIVQSFEKEINSLARKSNKL